jgi:hypothetical protein
VYVANLYSISLLGVYKLDIYGSVHQDIIYENDQKDATV